VSALAHLLEERGLPTTVIASVLPQVEKTRPPRAVMTPFMLGRPLGEPNDVPFQRRVLLQALDLLTRNDGPVILEHFPDDPPAWTDRSDWRPAVDLPVPKAPLSGEEWEVAFRQELALIQPAWDRFKARFGRTTVGLAGLAVEGWPALVRAFLEGQLPMLTLHQTPALALRFLVDDIKAFYGEAVQADGPPPSARQIDRWFWRETVAGQMLLALRSMAMKSDNNALKTVGGRFFVPAPYLPA
jgi:hypothetical protein